MAEKINKYHVMLGLSILLGVGLRIWIMSTGSGFDFESYTIVGQLVSDGKNVYAGTTRYNYGPIFFLIQGLCYKISLFFSEDVIYTYRILIVLALTLADLGIAFLIMFRYSMRLGILFFLNPISIIITGRHNQFDNIAVFLIFCSAFFYNEEEKLTKKDFLYVIFAALSLITKHVMFMLPFWVFVKKGLPVKKRLLYSVAPVGIFLLSFVPFILGNIEAAKGVLYNVFLYRGAWGKGMLFYYIGGFLGIPQSLYFILFILMLIILGCVGRNWNYEYQIMIYLLAQVIFASSSAPQYLAIPCLAVCILGTKWLRYMFFVVGGICLFFIETGIRTNVVWIARFGDFMNEHGYVLSSLVLLGILFYEIVQIKIKSKEIT